MISISVRSKYGLSAVLALALAPKGKPLQSKQIADTYGLPQNYLEQLLLDLKRSGIVTSLRGRQGGYILAKSPEQLTVLDVLNCLEGQPDLSVGSCLSLAGFWKQTESEIQSIFCISIQELLTRTQKDAHTFTYAI